MVDTPTVIPEEINAQGHEVFFTASLESSPETKTTIDDQIKVYWTPGDEVMVFSAGESAKFTAINTSPSRVAKFRGVVSFIMGYDETGETTYAWALYPYRSNAAYSEPANAQNPTYEANLTTYIPAVQYGRAGTFDDGYAVSVARSESLNFKFKNAYSGYRISFDRDDITSVELKSLDGESLSGGFTLGMDSSNVPYVVSVDEGYDTIIFYAPDGGTFEKNKYYYIMTLPDIQIATGLSFTLHRSDGYQGTYTLRSSNPFLRNYFRYFGTGNNQSVYLNGRLESSANIQAGMSTGWVAPGQNQIWYTTWDHQPLETYNATQATGNVVVSNTYDADADQGVITFQNDVTVLDDRAFAKDNNEYNLQLRSVTLPSGLQVIGKEAFSRCYQMQTVYMGDNVTVIGERAFQVVGNLRSIRLSSSLQALGELAFSNCISLTGITLPQSLTTVPAVWPDWPDRTTVELGNNPFFYTTSLESFSGAGASADGAFFLADGGERLVAFARANPGHQETCTVPQGVKCLGKSALNMAGIHGLSLPEGLETISDKAVKGNSNYTELTIPSSVTYIGAEAFYENYDLTKIVIKGILPPTLADANAFQGAGLGPSPIYVPLGSKAFYNSGTWSTLYSRIVESEYPADNQIYYTGTYTDSDGLIHSLPTGSPNEFDHDMCFFDPSRGYGLITFKQPLTVLDDNYLYNNQYTMGLTGIVLPESLEVIGNNCFRDCTNLASVKMGNNVKVIGTLGFHNCSSLSQINLSTSLEAIGDQAFAYCVALTNITLPQSLQCLNARWTSWPQTYTSTGSNSFLACDIQRFSGKFASQDGAFLIDDSSLLSFAINHQTQKENCVVPEGVEYISQGAFMYADYLKTVKLPQSLTRIFGFAFAHCEALEEVNIPASVQTLEAYSLFDCTHLTTVRMESRTAPTLVDNALSNSPNAIIYVPLPIDESYQTGTNWSTLYNAGRIVGYLPDSPASNQIYYSTEDHIVFPYETDYIYNTGNEVVSNVYYSDLDTGVITFGNNLTILDDYAFREKTNSADRVKLKSIVLPDCLEVIGSRAFAFSSLESIHLGNNVKIIGDFAFSPASSLQSIDLPEGLLAIGECAFSNCHALTSIRIPSTVTTIPAVWPNWPDRTVVTQGDSPFFNCSNLASFSGKFASQDGALLITDPVDGSSGSVLISYAPANTSLSSSVVVPSGVTKIGRSALESASFSDIELPESLTSIETYAFSSNSNLSSVVLPKGVTEIKNGAFNNCSSLTELRICSHQAPAIGATDVFNNVNSNFKVHVPGYCVGYNAGNWLQFCSDNSKFAVYQAEDEVWMHCGANDDYSQVGTGTVFAACGLEHQGSMLIPMGSGITRYEPAVPFPTVFTNSTVLEVVCFEQPVTAVLPQSFMSWDNTAYGNLDYVSLPVRVSSIGAEAFHGCEHLKAFPAAADGTYLTSIGQHAFDGCTAMAGMPNLVSLTSTGLGSYAFQNCQAITAVTLPGYNIPDYAFFNCYALTSVSLLDDTIMTSVGQFAFMNDDHLAKLAHQSVSSGLVLPNLQTIGQSAFNSDRNITSASLPSLKTLNYNGLASMSGLTTLELPAIETIGTYALGFASNLTSVTFGPNLMYVGQKIFYNSNNASTLPSITVTFQGTTTVPAFAQDAFASNAPGGTLVYYPADKLTILVPSSKLAEYQAAITLPEGYENCIVGY